MDTSQGCLNALLSQDRDPKFLLDRINQLVEMGNLPGVVDLTHQSWPAWSNDDDLKNILIALESLMRLDVLNLSAKEVYPTTLSYEKIDAISRFIKKIQPTNFIFRNQMLNANSSSQFSQSFVNTSTQSIDLMDTVIGDIGAAELGRVIPFSLFKKIIFKNNSISDISFPAIINSVNHSHVDSLSLDGNDLTDASLDAIPNNMALQALSLSFMTGFTADGLDNFGKTLSKSIVALRLSGNNFENDQVVAFSPYMSQSHVQFYDFSYNNLDSEESAIAFFTNLPKKSLDHLDVSYTKLQDESALLLADFVSDSNLKELIIKGNVLAIPEWTQLVQAIVNSKEEYLDMGNNEIDDEKANILAAELQKKPCHLRRINLLDNNISDKGGVELSKAFSVAGVTDINFSGNLLTGVFAKKLAAQLHHADNFIGVDISNNPIDSESLTELVQAIPGSSLKQFTANEIHIENQDSITIVKSLVFSPVTNDLSFIFQDTLSKDQKRVPFSLTTNLTGFSLNQLSATAKLGLDRIVSRASISNETIPWEKDAFDGYISKNQSLSSTFSPSSSRIASSANTVVPGSTLGLMTAIYLLHWSIKSWSKPASFALQKLGFFNSQLQETDQKDHVDTNQNKFEM